MANTLPKGKIVISLHNLYIEIEHEATYPDQMTDLSSRAMTLFTTAMAIAKESCMDIRDFNYAEFDSEDED